ncbi:hypothetical protein ACFLWS_05275 [Chloroflexota bacterium]
MPNEPKPLTRIAVLLFLFIPALTLAACGPVQEGTTVSPTEQQPIEDELPQQDSNQSGIDLPPRVDKPKRKETKLRPILVDLVEAYENGDVEAFASSRGIKLRNGSVLVTIESLPGQMDVAKQAAINAGARLGAGHRNSQDIIVPIGNLADLAEEESIRFIEWPEPPATES